MALESLPRTYGQRLTALRNIHGLTQADLAHRLGVTQSFLSHIERGNRPMPENLLLYATREFNLPVSFFTIQPSSLDVGCVTFRKTARAGARDESRVITLYDEASRLFRCVSKASGYRSAELPSPAEYEHDVEMVAEALREAAGMSPEDPVLNATRALERFGIGVVDNLDHLEEAGGHAGISRPCRLNDRPLVALVTDLPGAVKRLTLLHEVCHLIFDLDLPAPIGSTRSVEEQRAFRFAGAFLLPEKVVRQRVSETLNLHGYLPIKADYGISVGAIIRRARDLGIISPARYRSLNIQLSSQGWRSNEPVPVADEKPLLLAQAVRKVYGRRASARAAEDIGASPDWINRWTHAYEHARSGSGKVIDLSAARRRSRGG